MAAAAVAADAHIQKVCDELVLRVEGFKDGLPTRQALRETLHDYVDSMPHFVLAQHLHDDWRTTNDNRCQQNTSRPALLFAWGELLSAVPGRRKLPVPQKNNGAAAGGTAPTQVSPPCFPQALPCIYPDVPCSSLDRPGSRHSEMFGAVVSAERRSKVCTCG